MANNEISLEEHTYNAFRIDVLERKILMLEKKIIEMKKTEPKAETNQIWLWTSTITSAMLLLMISDLYSRIL
jgi:hypothetical protein